MKKLCLALLFSITLCRVMAQGSWQLKKNENGIFVYTRTPASGNLKELRVVCEFDATKTQLIATLQDIDHYKDWVYSSKKTEILKTPSPQKTIYYTQSRLPWPIKDRDLVVELDIGAPEADVLYIHAKSLPTYLPKNDKFVRVPYSLAVWKVTPASNNKLKIDYTFSVDPGGSLPAWLVNATLAIGPYNSFVKLKEVLKKEKRK
ncbi:MAG: START domain-containing protein [Mucilaginibacter sp.]